MGGSALLIFGNVNGQVLEPKPAPRSITDRLFGRTRAVIPEWIPLGANRKMITVPSPGLDTLGGEFRDHVATRFTEPWAATRSIIDYLRLDITTVYLRSDREDDKPPEWYVQLMFSGCAGMAQTASELCSHWAERWFREQRDRITTQILQPNGFEPNGRTEPGGVTSVFVPIGPAGYALYTETPPADGELDHGDSRYFEVDASASDDLEEDETADAMRTLDERVRPLIPSGQCCCQWCAPALDVRAFDRASPFK